MLKVDFKFNAPDLTKALMKVAAEGVVKRVEGIRCPVHGQHAHVVVSGSKPGQLKFDVRGCCDQLISEVKARLKS